MITDREYQIEAVSSIWKYFQVSTGNPVVAMPTGTGKSVVIARFLESVFRAFSGQRVMVLTHVKELIAQNYEKLMTLWSNAPAGIHSAGLNRKDVLERIIFAGIGSVAKKAEVFGKVDLLIIDEAHLVSPSEATMYQKFISALLVINPYLKVIGFTATPWRMGHGKITDDGIFTDICFDITGPEAFNRLIAEGYLCPLIPKKTQLFLDTEGVHMRNGDFAANELQIAVDRDDITMAALRETIELASDRRHWLIFAAGVEHATHIASMMESLGISCIAVHSKMSGNERDDAIRRFKSGEVRAVVNNNVLTTGFDFPAIDLIVILRPTMSSTLWVQMLGRGTRPFSCIEYVKRNCLVLDFAGNTKRLGPINDPVIPRKKGSGTGEAPVKLCPVCNTWNHATVRNCIECGNEFHFQTKIKEGASTDEIIRGELPVVEQFKVDHVTYAIHKKLDRPDSLRVSYYCAYKKFDDFVCVGHDGYALRKARQWWKERNDFAMPTSAEEALARASELKVPTHLNVWTNKQHPQIMSYCYDGTSFGTKEADDLASPTVEVRGSKVTGPILEEDDIPF